LAAGIFVVAIVAVVIFFYRNYHTNGVDVLSFPTLQFYLQPD